MALAALADGVAPACIDWERGPLVQSFVADTLGASVAATVVAASTFALACWRLDPTRNRNRNMWTDLVLAALTGFFPITLVTAAAVIVMLIRHLPGC